MRDIYHFLPLSPALATAGQPAETQLQEMARQGYSLVINLGLLDPRYCLEDEAGLVQALGMRYEHIPVDFKAPGMSGLERFFAVMDAAAEEKVFVHCAANYRVSCFISLYGQARWGWSEAQADAHVRRMWEPDAVWRAFLQTARQQLPEMQA